MNWIIGILVSLVILFLVNNYIKKKRLQNLKKRLLANWGKPKETKYFNFYVIKKYFENSNKEFYHQIPDNTKDDLDLEELFKFLDRTSSKIGQQYLYYKIRTIKTIEKLKNFSKLNQLFLTNDKLRLESQVILSKLNSENAYDLEKLIHDEPIKKPKYLKLIYASSITSVVLISLSFFNPIFSLLLLPIFSVNAVFHYRNKSNVTYYINGVNQLSKALKVSKELSAKNEIKSHFTDLSFIKKINNIKTKTEFIGFEDHLLNEYAMLFWVVFEIIKIQFMVEYIIFFSFVDSIKNEKESIHKLFQFIGEIDSAIAVASIKSGNLTYCEPTFTNSKHINTTEITHPLIENCVANNLNLKSKSLLLTGSNMSGKTTFIRTIALNSVLAQTLHICFAKVYSAPFFKLYSSIRISDNLFDEESYYLKEVLTIKKLIEASKNDEPCLFVLDEIFKGTNTIERISGGKAILSFLNEKNHTVLVSTHDIELTKLLEKDNYELHHFSESIIDDELKFDHKLKSGELKTRNAIKILELYKYPSKIIDNAKKTEKENFA